MDSPPLLTSLVEYDRLRASPSAVNRTNSVDVVTTDQGTTLEFCHLAVIMPYSAFRPERIPLQNGVAQGQAAVLLAAQHLNTGNGSIVSSVEGLNERCNIRFTAEFFDTELSQATGVDTVIDLVSREPATEQLPCAFLGAARSAVSIPTSIITGLRKFPQISPASTSTQLNDKSQHPLFGRTIPSDDGTAIPAILYLRHKLNVKHLAVVHINDSYGNAYALGLQLAAAEFAPEMKVVRIDMPFEATPEIMQKTVSFLKQTEYRYFFGIIFSTAHYEPFMTEAVKQGIAGTGMHTWFFSDAISTSAISSASFQRGSPIHLASKGALRIGAVGGIPGIPIYDKFIESIKNLNNPEDIEYLREKHPTYPEEPDYEPLAVDDAFFDGIDGPASFLYDATIALGLAACNVTKPDTYFDGIAHFQAVLNTTFEGATGEVLLDPVTGTRIATSARFTLLNFVEDPVDDSSKNVTFSMVETDVFQNGEWQSLESVLFNDGSSIPPPDLPQVTVDMNYIGTGWRAAGLAMAGMILVLSIGFAIWTQRKRNRRVVKASQPLFLFIICAGCFLMGSSVIPLSVDDEIASEKGCDIACIAFPWILSFGWVISFSALFTKTHRINKIFHGANFKRIVVTPWDVMKPMIALLAANVLVLSLWTALDPPHWERVYMAEDEHGRPVESHGFCTYSQSIPYVAALAGIFVVTLAFACYQAYMARDISTEFAESEYIAKAMGLILVVCFIGIPVIIIANEDPTAAFFVITGIIFVVSVSLLLMIFVPKVRQSKLKRRSSLPRLSGLTSRASRLAQASSAPDSEEESEAPGVKILAHPGLSRGFRQSVQGIERIETGGLIPSEEESDAPGVKILAHPGSSRGFHQNVQDTERIETGHLTPCEEESEAPGVKLLAHRVLSRGFLQNVQDTERIDTEGLIPSEEESEAPGVKMLAHPGSSRGFHQNVQCIERIENGGLMPSEEESEAPSVTKLTPPGSSRGFHQNVQGIERIDTGGLIVSEEELEAPGVKILAHPGSSRGFHQNVQGIERIESGDLIPSEQSDLHRKQTCDEVEKVVELVDATEANHH